MTRLQFLRKLIGSSSVIVAVLFTGAYKAFARTCPECLGTGHCTSCRGRGDKQCLHCYGTGRVQTFKAGVGSTYVTCSFCRGSGRTACSACGGSGRCGLCHGSGEIPDRNQPSSQVDINKVFRDIQEQDRQEANQRARDFPP